MENKGLLREIAEKTALERRILHPSSGDHISVSISGKGGTESQSSKAVQGPNEQRLRNSGSATYRKKGASKLRLEKASVSERQQSKKNSNYDSKESSLKILGSEEASFSEVVISDS